MEDFKPRILVKSVGRDQPYAFAEVDLVFDLDRVAGRNPDADLERCATRWFRSNGCRS
jgi:hypothetical protein